MSAFDPKRTLLWLRLTPSRLVVGIATLSCLILGGTMRRRDFIILLGGVTVRPTAARAQQPSVPVIGFLRSTAAVGSEHLVKAFRQGLSEAGFVEGQNIAIEYRWADDQFDRLPGLAADLVRQQVAAIVGNAGVARVAKAATTTIPIIFVAGLDPVKTGLGCKPQSARRQRYRGGL